MITVPLEIEPLGHSVVVVLNYAFVFRNVRFVGFLQCLDSMQATSLLNADSSTYINFLVRSEANDRGVDLGFGVPGIAVWGHAVDLYISFHIWTMGNAY